MNEIWDFRCTRCGQSLDADAGYICTNPSCRPTYDEQGGQFGWQIAGLEKRVAELSKLVYEQRLAYADYTKKLVASNKRVMMLENALEKKTMGMNNKFINELYSIAEAEDVIPENHPCWIAADMLNDASRLAEEWAAYADQLLDEDKENIYVAEAFRNCFEELTAILTPVKMMNNDKSYSLQSKRIDQLENAIKEFRDSYESPDDWTEEDRQLFEVLENE